MDSLCFANDNKGSYSKYSSRPKLSLLLCVVLPFMYTQIYRCVLLNNGLRRQPQPDSSSSSSLTPEEGAAAEGNHTSLVSGAPQDQRSDIAVGSRGDIIMFYNKVFISLIKNYALKFTPGENEVGFHPLLQCTWSVWCAVHVTRSLSLSLLLCIASYTLSSANHTQDVSLAPQTLPTTPHLCVPTYV